LDFEYKEGKIIKEWE
jgi:hypothetical protein